MGSGSGSGSGSWTRGGVGLKSIRKGGGKGREGGERREGGMKQVRCVLVNDNEDQPARIHRRDGGI